MRGIFWSAHLFVLLSPDALRRGIGGPLVYRLREERFRPVAARLVRAGADMIDELYSDVIAGSWQTWRYRLVDRCFAFGPTLALICRHTGSSTDLHALMRARKGHSDPFRSEPGTIRRDFGAINSVLGVMHASDNPVESERDSAIFGLTEAQAVASAETDQRIDRLVELATPVAPERRGYCDVIAGVRARLLQPIVADLPPARLRALDSAFPRTVDLGVPDAGSRLVDLLGLPAADPFAIALGCEFTPQWRERHPRARIWDSLRHADVTLDDWERLVLDTSLWFPSVRAPRPVAVSA